MKTAEEILHEYMPKESGHFSKKCILKAMQSYADQFKNDWVRVEEQYPPLGVMVLTGYWYHKEFLQRVTFNDGITLVEFTHWQPLPSPPKTTEI